jgi:hypothetical protein
MELICILPIFLRVISPAPPAFLSVQRLMWRPAFWCGVSMSKISATCGNMLSIQNPPLSRLPWRILFLAAICLWQSGCFEIIRRQSAHEGTRRSWWADGNQEEGRDVQRDGASSQLPDSTVSSGAVSLDGGDPSQAITASLSSDTLALSSDTLALSSDTLALSSDTLALSSDTLALSSDTLAVDLVVPKATGPVPEDGMDPAGLAIAADVVEQTLTEKRPKRTQQERHRLAAGRAARTRKQREVVKQVNAYALWCIDHEMWKEARLHLERATEEDSLAGSLFNNLGLVYERLGMPDRAEIAYERAGDLNPDREAYHANLRRLHQRREAAERAEPARLDSLKMELEGLDFEPVQPHDGEPRNTLLPPLREGVGAVAREQVTRKQVNPKAGHH